MNCGLFVGPAPGGEQAVDAVAGVAEDVLDTPLAQPLQDVVGHLDRHGGFLSSGHGPGLVSARRLGATVVAAQGAAAAVPSRWRRPRRGQRGGGGDQARAGRGGCGGPGGGLLGVVGGRAAVEAEGEHLGQVQARRPVPPCSIWVRQLKPSASTRALGAAARTAGQQHPLGGAPGHLVVAALEAEVAGQAAAAGVQHVRRRPRPGASARGRRRCPVTACWWQWVCTVARPGRARGGCQPSARVRARSSARVQGLLARAGDVLVAGEQFGRVGAEDRGAGRLQADDRGTGRDPRREHARRCGAARAGRCRAGRWRSRSGRSRRRRAGTRDAEAGVPPAPRPRPGRPPGGSVGEGVRPQQHRPAGRRGRLGGAAAPAPPPVNGSSANSGTSRSGRRRPAACRAGPAPGRGSARWPRGARGRPAGPTAAASPCE